VPEEPKPPVADQAAATYDVQWSDEHEKLFLGQRAKTKQLFTNEVTSSSWNDLGFLPILQQLSL
jgi:hypothetical protein